MKFTLPEIAQLMREDAAQMKRDHSTDDGLWDTSIPGIGEVIGCYEERQLAIAYVESLAVGITKDEAQRMVADRDALCDGITQMKMEIKHLKAIKLPPPDVDCVVAFGHWYGMPVEQDMDIQTQVAWEHWQLAWNAAIASEVRKRTSADQQFSQALNEGDGSYRP